MALRSQLRRIPAARSVARRARTSWDAVRPLPAPRYRPGTPRLGSNDPLDPFVPLNPQTLAAAAFSGEATAYVLELLDRLSPDEDFQVQKLFYQWSRAKFGEHLRYADLHTVLWGAATLLKPGSYLEIGVYKGRSAAIVATLKPSCAIYGFDLWSSAYGSYRYPGGADFVREELRRLGHQGELHLVAGDSRRTIPAFLAAHPELFFDLITVDGDHTVPGASTDLANVLPRLKVGGVLVFDDLCNPPALQRVWDKLVRRDLRYATWEFAEGPIGVAAAIRVADQQRTMGEGWPVPE